MSTDGLVYLVCDVMNNQPSPPTQTQLAYESVNEGSSWSAGNPPPQPPQGVTAVVGERFAWNFEPDLYMLTGHGWQVSLTGRGHGFSLVGFETNTQGVALGTNGYLWITRNGGSSWSLAHRLTDARCGPWPADLSSALRVTASSAAVRIAHAYGLAVLAVFPAGDQLRRGRQGLGQPVPGRLQRDPQPRIPGRGDAGPALLRRAELRGDADDVGQVQHFAFPGVRVGADGGGHGSVGGVPVRPERADDHRRVGGIQQRPHHRAGQSAFPA